MLSEDGSERVAETGRFAVGDLEAPADAGAGDARPRAAVDPPPVRGRMRKLLLLRPEPGLSASAERARALGLEVIACPLFAIEPVEWEAPDPADYDALLLTSANAVRHGGHGLDGADKPCRSMRSARRPRPPRATPGFSVAKIGRRRCRPICSPACRARCGCCTWRARIIARSADSAADRPRDRLSLAPRSTIPACHRSRTGRRGPQPACRSAAGRTGRPTRIDTAIAAISEPPPQACGSGWERIESRRASPTIRACWPSPRGCVTHRRPDDRDPSRQGLSWTARLAWALLLLVAGAALATWGLSRWEAGARFLGIAPRQPLQVVAPGRQRPSRPSASRSAGRCRRAAHRGARSAAGRNRKPGPGRGRLGRARRRHAGRLRRAPRDRSRRRARLSRALAGPALRRSSTRRRWRPSSPRRAIRFGSTA